MPVGFDCAAEGCGPEGLRDGLLLEPNGHRTTVVGEQTCGCRTTENGLLLGRGGNRDRRMLRESKGRGRIVHCYYLHLLQQQQAPHFYHWRCSWASPPPTHSRSHCHAAAAANRQSSREVPDENAMARTPRMEAQRRDKHLTSRQAHSQGAIWIHRLESLSK